LEIFRFDPTLKLRMKTEVFPQNVVQASQEFRDEEVKDFAELDVAGLQSACSIAQVLQ